MKHNCSSHKRGTMKKTIIIGICICLIVLAGCMPDCVPFGGNTRYSMYNARCKELGMYLMEDFSEGSDFNRFYCIDDNDQIYKLTIDWCNG